MIRSFSYDPYLSTQCCIRETLNDSYYTLISIFWHFDIRIETRPNSKVDEQFHHLCIERSTILVIQSSKNHFFLDKQCVRFMILRVYLTHIRPQVGKCILAFDNSRISAINRVFAYAACARNSLGYSQMLLVRVNICLSCNVRTRYQEV